MLAVLSKERRGVALAWWKMVAGKVTVDVFVRFWIWAYVWREGGR
jgi:hypothetical protein